MKTYRISIYSSNTHSLLETITMQSESYATACIDSAAYCKQHYNNAYVARIEAADLSHYVR